ncbi:MAG TPA: GNAT family N-acetyltransferase [Bacteroidia bacterium]|nr:GNAT family N-acetyltransferase [Bacteroidia bacterium]
MNSILITARSGENEKFSSQQIANFLEKHLDQFGDKNEDILKAIQYALNPEKGGFILLRTTDEQIIGAVVINETGMDGYIPANILVYIATHRDYRGQGIGKKMMLEAMTLTQGGIALHVEPDNPAKKLYEKLGFTNKYLEMRFIPGK